MRIQRLFSHTWTNIKDPGERTKKTKELINARREINQRIEDLKKTRNEDLKKAALGELRNKDGKRLNSEVVMKRFEADMNDINAYRDSIRDTKSRTPKKTKPKIKVDSKSGLEKTVENIKAKGKRLLKKPETKKLGYLSAGALGGTLAVSGVDKAIKMRKEKKKENEAREQVLGNETNNKNSRS